MSNQDVSLGCTIGNAVYQAVNLTANEDWTLYWTVHDAVSRAVDDAMYWNVYLVVSKSQDVPTPWDLWSPSI